MENIAPPLKLLLRVRRNLERNHPVRQGVLDFLADEHTEFSMKVSHWFSLLQQGQPTGELISSLPSIHRRLLLQVLERGMRGESIYPMLCQLESELIEACHEEIEGKLARLPILLMVPLLMMQFPAILLLLFGPLLQNFFHSFGGG